MSKMKKFHHAARCKKCGLFVEIDVSFDEKKSPLYGYGPWQKTVLPMECPSCSIPNDAKYLTWIPEEDLETTI